jgi:hypothetical protein
MTSYKERLLINSDHHTNKKKKRFTNGACITGKKVEMFVT